MCLPLETWYSKTFSLDILGLFSADDTQTAPAHKNTHTDTHLTNMYSQVIATINSLSDLTGVIYTAGILDCETKDAYWLTVYATDKGVSPLSASIEVFIQVHTL